MSVVDALAWWFATQHPFVYFAVVVAAFLAGFVVGGYVSDDAERRAFVRLLAAQQRSRANAG